MTSTDPVDHPQEETSGPQFFAWLPWEKLTIWALFLFLVWSLADFFTVIFLTFIFSYITTSVVRRILGFFPFRREPHWLHRILVVVVFCLFLFGLFSFAALLKDPFKEQLNSLRVQFRALELQPETLWEDLARGTIGKWRFRSYYAEAEDGQYAKDLESYRREEFYSTELERFREFDGQIRLEFEEKVKDEHGALRVEELKSEKKFDTSFREWVVTTEALPRYESERDLWNANWTTSYIDDWGTQGYKVLQKDPERFQAERRAWILEQITDEALSRAEVKDKLASAFAEHLGELSFSELRKNEAEFEQQFKSFYDTRLRIDDAYSYETFAALSGAVGGSSGDEFQKVLLGDKDPEAKEREIARSFERTRQEELAQAALKDWEFLQLDKLKEEIQQGMPKLAGLIVGWGRNFFNFVIMFALSLLLSFFIAFDLPRIKKGIRRLEKSRVQDFYHEIAPGLAAFGSLIGRAFQAQGVIAICNTLLTLVLIRTLQIPFEIFLCSIVFVCSFIPVLGVVLSTVPIALVALLHNSVPIALFSVGGVLLIHFLETSVLNPKILGEMLHLHPVMVLAILVIGEHFFHVWGLLLGVPVMVYIIRYVILNESVLPGETIQKVAKLTGVKPAPSPDAAHDDAAPPDDAEAPAPVAESAR